MWKTKLCLSTNSQFGLSDVEQIKAFSRVGFDGFFVNWQRGMSLGECRSVGNELGMIFQSVHAPYTNSANMWQEGEKARDAVDELMECLDECKKNNVDLVICHAYIGFEANNDLFYIDNVHEKYKRGIENYGKVVSMAENLGIKIAFENTEGDEYLKALMMTFWDRENVGFCWDTGHELCYNHYKDMMSLYGDKIMATHINDNLGVKDFNGEITYIDDLHLLPFDGINDWNSVCERLNKYKFTKILTFELNTKSKPGRMENDAYDNMNIEQYLCEAYKRACRVCKLVQK